MSDPIEAIVAEMEHRLDAGFEAELLPLTKKPIAGSTDDVYNPRARSSKLRVAVKK